MNRRTVLATLGVLGTLPAFALRARAADAPLIRLATPPTDSSAMYFYAETMGFFKKYGLNAEVTTLANGEAVTNGIIGGSLDIGNGQAITLIIAYSKGIPITVIGGSGINTVKTRAGSSGAFFVPNASSITSGKDLNGKTVGVQGLRGFAQYGTMAWIDRTGGDSSTVKFVEMSSSVMGAALSDNRLDGAFIPEPNVSAVAKLAKKIANPMDTIAPSFYSGAHFAMLAWAKAHADVVKRFEECMYETAAWANKNQDRTAEILASAVKMDISLVRNAVRIEYSTRRDPSLLQPMIDLAARYGGIKPFPADDIFFKA